MDDYLKGKETFGELKVKSSKRVKPMSSHTSDKVADDTVEIDTTHLFQRIIYTIQEPEELQECLSFEFASVPLSMFDQIRLMRKTKKSVSYNIFNDA